MRSLQNCYCDFDACERSAQRETEKDGRERMVYANAAGYWYFVPGFAKPPKREQPCSGTSGSE